MNTSTLLSKTATGCALEHKTPVTTPPQAMSDVPSVACRNALMAVERSMAAPRGQHQAGKEGGTGVCMPEVGGLSCHPRKHQHMSAFTEPYGLPKWSTHHHLDVARHFQSSPQRGLTGSFAHDPHRHCRWRDQGQPGTACLQQPHTWPSFSLAPLHLPASSSAPFILLPLPAAPTHPPAFRGASAPPASPLPYVSPLGMAEEPPDRLLWR